MICIQKILFCDPRIYFFLQNTKRYCTILQDLSVEGFDIKTIPHFLFSQGEVLES